jgi:lysozyme family protein
MAVKIQTYEDRLTPSGSGVQAQARGVEVSDALGRSLQAFGQEGTKLAAQQLHFMQKKDDDDAIANVGKTMSDASLHWDEYLKKSQETATDGAPGYTGRTVAEFDKYAEETLAGITNPKAQQFARAHLNSMRTQIGAQSINFEARAGVADRDTKLEQAFQNYGRIVAADSSKYESSRQALQTMIANLGYDPVTRADRSKRYLERLGELGITGENERNPAGVKSTLSRTYGGDFGHSLDFTLRAEGGLNPSDTNGTPTNFGINQAAHPEVDVKTLTKEQAGAIYKKDYWDKIGGDQLAQQNPALATIAFDTAVIAGVGRAKDLLAQAGGDPAKFMDLREAYLNKLKADDPQKYDKYTKAWSTRNANLRAEIGTAGAATSPIVSRMAQDVNVERLPAFINAAQTEENRQQATYRAGLATTEGDHITAYMNGAPVQKPLSEQEYTRAYGPVEGPQRYANYQAIAQLGSDMNALKLQTPEQMAETARKYEPDSTKPGYELATKRYETILKAIDGVNAQRSADPMAYAQANKVGDAKPLNFNDQAAFGSELNRRIGVANTMQQTYGTPYSILSKAEATTLNQGFQRMTTQQRLGYLNTIRTSVTDPVAYRSVMQQIAPDSPVTAMAGMILQKQNPNIVKTPTKVGPVSLGSWEAYTQQDVAGLMLEGEALLNPNKLDKSENGKGRTFPMPEDKDMRPQFISAMGKAFASDPDGANFAYQAVKAYYAGKASREGDISGVIDSGRLKEAINAVTGGVTNINGNGEVIRPWGMTEERFTNGAKAAFDKAIEAAGYKGTQIDNWGTYGLQSAGDSKYLARSGTGYLIDKKGNPIVLDLTEKENMAKYIPTRDEAPPAASTAAPPATITQDKTTKPNTQQPKTK